MAKKQRTRRIINAITILIGILSVYIFYKLYGGNELQKLLIIFLIIGLFLTPLYTKLTKKRLIDLWN